MGMTETTVYDWRQACAKCPHCKGRILVIMMPEDGKLPRTRIMVKRDET